MGRDDCQGSNRSRCRALVVGTIVCTGGVANGIGSYITDKLDNIDHTNDKYKTNTQIRNDAFSNAGKGMFYSIPGAAMGWMTDFYTSDANLKMIQDLMPGYTRGFGRGLD